MYSWQKQNSYFFLERDGFPRLIIEFIAVMK